MPTRTRRKSFAKRRPGANAGTKLPKNAVTLTVVLRSREGQEASLEAELRALVAPTRREEGCLVYELHRAEGLPGTFLLHEVWASREHHNRHTKTAHFLCWSARKDALLASRDAIFWTQLT